MKKTFERKREGTLSSFNFPLSTCFGGACRRSHGFTLIEMLVVIVIMVILMGVVFRLASGAMAKGDVAKEQALVTKVRTLIEEFHAEYNIYPPVPVYKTHDGKAQQPINFRGACPEATGKPQELNYYPENYSYAKITESVWNESARRHENKDVDCYFVFGLFSFFVDRSIYVYKRDGKEEDRRRAFNVAGSHGAEEATKQWGGYNDSVGNGGAVTVSQKDRAFARRVWPIVSELCNLGDSFDSPAMHTTVDIKTGYTQGFTTSAYGHWADGIGIIYRNDEEIKVYDEGLVYISKPPYTTYLLFSKGPDNAYEEPADDRTLPLNKDNIYGNLGDK